MWHDSWSMLPTLDSVVSRREIYSAGFTNDTTLAECIEDKKWKWPEQWLSEHPNLNQYPVPVLNIGTKDKLMWCSNEGSMKIFSSSQVWNDIRILNDKMLWWKVIWFPHNIPRQAFVLWMSSKVSLISPGKNSIWSIVRRLCIADTIIINSVRSKLLTLKVKDSSAVSEVEAKWGIQLIYLIEVWSLGFNSEVVAAVDSLRLLVREM
ncbi:hypothetical protein Tco_1466123 [Tanacetum coccineum]